MTFLTTTRCRRCIAWLLCALICTIFAGIEVAAQKTAAPFRVGFSSAMFTDVNENDASAALKVWGDMIAQEKNIPIVTTPRFFDKLDNSPAGKQVLTIFNSQRIVEKPPSMLESALKLIKQHREVMK